MLTAVTLVSRISQGWSVQVVRDGSERLVRILDRNQNTAEQHRLPVDVYEHVMQDAIAHLVAGHPDRFRIDTHIDFYGNVWAEVQSGLFGMNHSVLRISPRHISHIDALLGERSRAKGSTAA